jgi:hypothetical protein
MQFSYIVDLSDFKLSIARERFQTSTPSRKPKFTNTEIIHAQGSDQIAKVCSQKLLFQIQFLQQLSRHLVLPLKRARDAVLVK